MSKLNIFMMLKHNVFLLFDFLNLSFLIYIFAGHRYFPAPETVVWNGTSYPLQFKLLGTKVNYYAIFLAPHVEGILLNFLFSTTKTFHNYLFNSSQNLKAIIFVDFKQ